MSVVPIRTGVTPQPPEGEINLDLIAKLEELLELAKTGNLTGIAYAALYPGDFTGYNEAGRTTRAMIGALVMLQFDMCKADSEEE